MSKNCRVKMSTFDVVSLKRWFLQEKRDLPWRKDPTPYHVWISEVMLQQTQVEVVKGYFTRWMECFPTIEALASAPLDKVIKVWEGLGYYARARHLHAAAQQLLAEQGGQLPEREEDLRKIKGLGPYTVGAILSFAFHHRRAAVDGNVARVLSRYFLIEEDISKAAVKRSLSERVEKLLPEKEPWVIMEALIELGALICRKTPLCKSCPLQPGCLAHRMDKVHLLPQKGRSIATTYLQRFVAVVQCEGHFLLRREGRRKVMADLYEFPYVETEIFHDLDTYLHALLSQQMRFECHLDEVEHSFTRYRVKLFPSLWSVQQKVAVAGYEWIEDLDKISCSSGHRKIIDNFLLDFEKR